jgi:small subunit ribosomal protein S13
MPRILGVDVPGDKRVIIALTYIYGIGGATSREILKATDIDETVRGNDLTEDELSRLGSHIEKNYIIEGQLRRQEAQNVNRLREIKCYRGARHRAGLPVRGQWTKTNARTRKGPRKTVAGKKGVKDISRG